ncbi:hypothetical protein SKAU_G00064710 [Synaphobranchus kaupii]|uniref:Chemokine interleukin-8-like domain-containing protein n=1 Tax=Synaphobranchus kaupii TaxID=118154 RepID=A0A9Q1G6H8_SYNKA|nr:hypothetical protein SKAU_G00064710 [Synaphobranchus kaupii]
MKTCSVSLAGVLLLYLAVIFVSDSTADGERAIRCCTHYTRPSLIKKLPLECIQDYRKRHNRGVCKIDAVVLRTEYDRSFCSNPSSKVVREILKALRDRRRMKKSKLNTGRMKTCCV